MSGTAAATAFSAVALEAKPAPKTRRPNLLYVFSDQHRACSLPGEAFNQAMAPNLAAFRAQNCSMDKCVSNYPLCTPYRAIFMSGLYPQQSGVMGNEDILNPKVGPLGETFRAAGYHTGYVGKWHIHGQDRVGGEDFRFIPKGPYRMGFEDWHVWGNTNDHYHSWTFDQETGEKIFPEGWQPTRMTDEAITFLKAQDKDKPWFLVLSWNPPHPPFDPPPEKRDLYPEDMQPTRPNVQILPKAADIHKGVRTGRALSKAAQGYHGSITSIDEEFARVLKALEETGQADDTIVIYTSDHGEMMGSQGLMGKRVPFEESCRVPFFIRYPGVTRAGQKSDVLFSAVDIYPTLCGLAGVPVPAHCAGRDLSDAMRGKAIQEPDHVFLISQNEGAGSKLKGAQAAARNARPGYCPPYRGIRTRTHTYVMGDTGRWLLFDNVADPFQMKNLVEDPAQQPLIHRLEAEIEKWLRSVKDEIFPFSEAKKGIFRMTVSPNGPRAEGGADGGAKPGDKAGTAEPAPAN
jgi:arylsulfatase A-like enzyme